MRRTTRLISVCTSMETGCVILLIEAQTIIRYDTQTRLMTSGDVSHMLPSDD